MQPYKTAAFYTLGCKLNFSETGTISRLFKVGGYGVVDFDEPADIYVINTCSVTENADAKCRNIVRKALKNNPNAFVAVVGCYAQLKPEEIAKIDGVNLVLGANEKFNLLEHIEEQNTAVKNIVKSSGIKEVKEFIPGYSLGGRTRSFLKVQDGCDYFCTFCTIPLARGKSRSNTISETVKIAKELATTKVKEVVLTGVNIGDFGKEHGESFYDLIKELDKTEGIERFRISSIEPNLLSDEIIQFVANSQKFVPHFHIPLQSGSNRLLKAMRRKYNIELYTDRIKTIKSLIPNCCIGVDVIVGFPGESDEEFMKTYDYLKELDISYLHVFTYSERDNTTAIKMEGKVDSQKRSQRSKMLRILSEKKKRKFYEQQQGNTASVLFEETENNGQMQGFTENYIKVVARYNPEYVNKLMEVKLEELHSATKYHVKLKELSIA